MNLLIEVTIYFLLILGLITVCLTIFEKIRYIDPIMLKFNKDSFYSRSKKSGKVELAINLTDISEQDEKGILDAIEVGNYVDIYSIVDTVIVNNNK